MTRRLLLTLLLACTALSCTAQSVDVRLPRVNTTETVFLLHGICNSSHEMAAMAGGLTRAGFVAVNWSYPSRRYTIEDLADQLAITVNEHQAERIHFVGHSMGGLVIRKYLEKYRPPNVGRVVMIGTPNHGALLADRMHTWWLFRFVFGPAGQQMREGQNGTCTSAAIPECEFAVIAGGTGRRIGMNPFLRGDNDGTVTVASTQLGGCCQHAVLPYPHMVIQMMPETIRLTVRFLRTGAFTGRTELVAPRKAYRRA